MSLNTHTPRWINDTHRTRFYWGKCSECLIIQEQAFCIDDHEFMYNCPCGAAPSKVKRVLIQEWS